VPTRGERTTYLQLVDKKNGIRYFRHLERAACKKYFGARNLFTRAAANGARTAYLM
jgi:hypothetical protein